jgi:7-cyano-7-deazaguanine synthase
MKKTVLALSGGMDSSALLIKLLSEDYEVTALSFDYGQKHRLELHKANQLIMYLREHNLKVNSCVIDLKSLAPLLNSNLIEGGDEIPEGHYENENMVLTVVPNRNKIFSSIIQSVALSQVKDDRVFISLGIHAGDHAIYPDCREEFRDADYEAFRLGNYNAEMVKYYTPYLEWDKHEILKDAIFSCKKLNINFNEVFKRTNTSYKPITVSTNNGLNKEEYSDYKSASSVERIEAFIKLGRPDPIQYADETGLVSWRTAESHVNEVLSNVG